MKEQIEKQAIEEMAKLMHPNLCFDVNISECREMNGCDICHATRLYNAGYRKQSEGVWEWFEEWNPSTTEHPRECDECGWCCSECKAALADIVGGYWDNPDEKPNLHFCPNCGAECEVSQ